MTIHNKKVFLEIDEDKIVKCDALLAEIITNLNKKGYQTKKCCHGHYLSPKFISPKNKIPNIKEHLVYNYFCLVKEDEEYYYFDNILNINGARHCEIEFEEEANLPFLPEKFEVTPQKNSIIAKINLGKQIAENVKVLKSETEFEEAVEELIGNLKKWVADLPNINNKKGSEEIGHKRYP